jgi:hypothetical protein
LRLADIERRTCESVKNGPHSQSIILVRDNALISKRKFLPVSRSCFCGWFGAGTVTFLTNSRGQPWTEDGFRT